MRYLKNYRPVSILFYFSYVFEKRAEKRLCKYFNEQDMLSSARFGFRSIFLTKLAVHSLTENIYKNKAFNSLFHSTLLRNLFMVLLLLLQGGLLVIAVKGDNVHHTVILIHQ